MLAIFKKPNRKKIFKTAALALVLAIVVSIGYSAFFQDYVSAGPKVPSKGGTGAGILGGVAGGLVKGATWGIVFWGILNAINFFLSWLLGVVGSMLNYAFFVSTRPDFFVSAPIQTGWTMVRDFSNIFILVSLLIIAIGTILRIESYHAKRTLATLIVVAILINFSLPLSRVVIDASNVITLQFIDAIKVGNDGQIPDVATNAANALQLQELTGNVPAAFEKPPQQAAQSGSVPGNSIAIIPEARAIFFAPLLIGLGQALAVSAVFIGMQTLAEKLFSSEASLGDSGIVAGPFIKLVMNILLLLVANYVMIALAAMLLIRTIVLMFLLVFSPAGFAFIALPATASIGKDWWTTLIKQSFFAPALAILLWITISLGIGTRGALDAAGVGTGANTIIPLPKLFFLVFYLAMFYACLLLAKRMGAYGADAFINGFQSAKGMALGFVGGVALRNTVGRAGQALQQQKWVQRSYYGRAIAGGMAGAGIRGFSTAPEISQDEAQAVMKRAESEWPKAFEKASRGAKEAMLKNMSAVQRERLMANVSEPHRKVAEQITGVRFGAKEMADVEVERWKNLSDTEQKSRFAEFSPEATEKILRSFDDEKRARFMAHPDFASNAANIAAAQKIIDERFTTDEKKKHSEGVLKNTISTKQAAGQLPAHLDTLSDDELKDALRVMNRDQMQITLEAAKTNAALTQRIVEQVATKLTADEKDKFNGALRSVSSAAAGSYTDALKDYAARATTPEEKAARETHEQRTLQSISSQQQVDLWIAALKKGTGALSEFDDKMKKLSAEDLANFRRSFGPALDQKSASEYEDAWEHLPSEVRVTQINMRPDRIKTVYNHTASNAVKTSIENDIKQAGAQEKYTRAGTPDRKEWFRRLGMTAELTEEEERETAEKGAREVAKESLRVEQEKLRMQRESLAKEKLTKAEEEKRKEQARKWQQPL